MTPPALDGPKFQVHAKCPQCGALVGVIKRVFPRAFARHEARGRISYRLYRCGGSWTDAGEAAAAWLKERHDLLTANQAAIPGRRERALAAYETATAEIDKDEARRAEELAWLATVKP